MGPLEAWEYKPLTLMGTDGTVSLLGANNVIVYSVLFFPKHFVL